MIQMFNMKIVHPMGYLGELLFFLALLFTGFVALEKCFATVNLCFLIWNFFGQLGKLNSMLSMKAL